MSEVEGVRKLLQDLVTPDLKGLQIQVGNLEKTLQTSITNLEKSSQAALSALEKNVNLRFDTNKDITAQQLKTQQVEITSALESKLVKILAAVEGVSARLAYFEARFTSERHTPVYRTEQGWESSVFTPLDRVIDRPVNREGYSPRATHDELAESVSEFMKRFPATPPAESK